MARAGAHPTASRTAAQAVPGGRCRRQPVIRGGVAEQREGLVGVAPFCAIKTPTAWSMVDRVASPPFAEAVAEVANASRPSEPSQTAMIRSSPCPVGRGVRIGRAGVQAQRRPSCARAERRPTPLARNVAYIDGFAEPQRGQRRSAVGVVLDLIGRSRQVTYGGDHPQRVIVGEDRTGRACGQRSHRLAKIRLSMWTKPGAPSSHFGGPGPDVRWAVCMVAHFRRYGAECVGRAPGHAARAWCARRAGTLTCSVEELVPVGGRLGSVGDLLGVFRVLAALPVWPPG